MVDGYRSENNFGQKCQCGKVRWAKTTTVKNGSIFLHLHAGINHENTSQNNLEQWQRGCKTLDQKHDTQIPFKNEVAGFKFKFEIIDFFFENRQNISKINVQKRPGVSQTYTTGMVENQTAIEPHKQRPC